MNNQLLVFNLAPRNPNVNNIFYDEESYNAALKKYFKTNKENDFTAEDAKAANEEYRYNAILWLFFGIFGEWRWKRKGVYGDIYYTTFDKEMVKPLKELMK